MGEGGARGQRRCGLGPGIAHTLCAIDTLGAHSVPVMSGIALGNLLLLLLLLLLQLPV